MGQGAESMGKGLGWGRERGQEDGEDVSVSRLRDMEKSH